MALACVETTELGKETEFVAAEHEVGITVAVEVQALDGIDRGHLDHGWQGLDRIAAISQVVGDDGGAVIEGQDRAAVELFGGKEVVDGLLGVLFVFQILLLEHRQLAFHLMFEEYWHIFAVDPPGEDLIGDAVLVEIADPELYGVGGIGMEVEIFADVAEDEIGQAVTVAIADGEGFPPAVEVVEIGLFLCEMVFIPGVNMGGQPFTRDGELRCLVVWEEGPGCGGDHAEAGDGGVFAGGVEPVVILSMGGCVAFVAAMRGRAAGEGGWSRVSDVSTRG